MTLGSGFSNLIRISVFLSLRKKSSPYCVDLSSTRTVTVVYSRLLVSDLRCFAESFILARISRARFPEARRRVSCSARTARRENSLGDHHRIAKDDVIAVARGLDGPDRERLVEVALKYFAYRFLGLVD